MTASPVVIQARTCTPTNIVLFSANTLHYLNTRLKNIDSNNSGYSIDYAFSPSHKKLSHYNWDKAARKYMMFFKDAEGKKLRVYAVIVNENLVPKDVVKVAKKYYEGYRFYYYMEEGSESEY